MDVSLSILLFVALILLFLFGSRGKEEVSSSRPPNKPLPRVPLASKEDRHKQPNSKKGRDLCFHREEKKVVRMEKKRTSILPKDWKRAKSLKDAFIFSEILKRKDPFF
jgi:hypothetical protein